MGGFEAGEPHGDTSSPCRQLCASDRVFLPGSYGHKETYTVELLGGFSELLFVKHLAYCLAHGCHSVNRAFRALERKAAAQRPGNSQHLL